MRLPFIIASVVCSLVFTPSSQAATVKAKKTVSSRTMGLVIRVEGGGWGSANKEEIEEVLYSVADELLTRIPKKLESPIVVTHVEDNPVALYEKGAHGEYQVHLSAANKRWSQFAYQFAHELCHIISNYEQNVGADKTKYNQWFEETLCEAASLYTLRNMANSWETEASNPRWVSYAPALREYADQLINEGHRQLPANTSLAAWLAENEDKIRNDPYLRDKNEVIANLLLPLFEQNPENWDTLSYLNHDPADARNNLNQYLQNWYGNAPREHKEFIGKVLALLEGKEAATVVAEATATARHGATPGAPTSQAGASGPASR